MTRRYGILALSALFLLAFSGGLAQAQSSRIYFAGYMGLNTPSDSEFSESTTATSGEIQFKKTPSFGGALGLRLDDHWRVEAEASYRDADMDRIDFANGGSFELDGNLKTWLLMFNVYHDFDFEWQYIEPYITAGAGLARHEGTINDSSGLAIDQSDESFGFAWLVGGGLKYRVRDNLAFTGDYRYIGTTDPEFGSYDMDFGSHEIRLGIQYDLPLFK